LPSLLRIDKKEVFNVFCFEYVPQTHKKRKPFERVSRVLCCSERLLVRSLPWHCHVAVSHDVLIAAVSLNLTVKHWFCDVVASF